MECSSCHNPHGSTNVRLLKTGNSVNESCSTCHAEKRGPFLFEHAGISGDSCATCHDPHGSNNDRMLVAKLPFLCQRCHNHTRHPSTIYDNKVAADQQPAVQPQLRDLPFGDPRLEPSGRFDVPAAVAEAIMRNHIMLAACRPGRSRRRGAFAQDPPSLPPPTDPVEIGAQRVDRQVVRHGRFRRPHHVKSTAMKRATSAIAICARASTPPTCWLGRRTEDWNFEAQAWNIGYRDQSYQVDLQRVGRLTASFLWDQIPLCISRDTRRSTRRRSPACSGSTTRCSRQIQAGTKTLRNFEDQAVRFDLRTLRAHRPGRRVFNATPTDIVAAGQEHQPRRARSPSAARSASATPSNCRCRSTPHDRRADRARVGQHSGHAPVRLGWLDVREQHRERDVGQPAALRTGHFRHAVAGPHALVARQHADLPPRHRRGQPARRTPPHRLRRVRPGPQQRGPAAASPSTRRSRRPALSRADRRSREPDDDRAVHVGDAAVAPASRSTRSYRYADVDVQTPVFDADRRARSPTTRAFQRRLPAVRYHNVKRIDVRCRRRIRRWCRTRR